MMHFGFFVGGQGHGVHPLAEKFHAHVQLHRRRALLVNRPGKLFFSVDFTPKEVPSWRVMWVNRAKGLWGVKRKTSIVSCVIKCSHAVHMKTGMVAFTNWLWKGLYCTLVPHKALKARCISAIVSTRRVANTSMSPSANR